MFAPTYNKTDALTRRQKKICRFLHPDHAKAAFVFLSWIKPLEAIFVGRLAIQAPAGLEDNGIYGADDEDEEDGVDPQAPPPVRLADDGDDDEDSDSTDDHEEGDLYDGEIETPAAPPAAAAGPTNYLLFTKFGRKMGSDAIRESFSSTLFHTGNVSLKFSEYRDLAIAFERRNRRTNSTNAKLALIVAHQGGHSLKTEDEVYGRDGEENLDHGADWEWDFAQATTSWQALLFSRY